MKLSLELLIYGIVWIVFGVVFIGTTPQSNYYLYYSISLWLSVGVLLAYFRYGIASLITNKYYGKAR